MSQRLLIGIVAALAIAGGACIWLNLSPSATQLVANVRAVAPPLKNPLGDAMDKNDPGQQHFTHGRYPEAVAYWMKAAASGDVAAAHRLGVEYMDGKPWVLARDYAKSLQFHRQAAAAGDALSMFDIGTIYEYGYGVPKNIAMAARWYGHAARYGLAQAQYNFATMLESGEGVARDEVEAYKYFVLAARGGFDGVPYNNETLRIDRNAPSPTALLARRLSRQQIEEGRTRADNFKRASGPLKDD